MSKAERDSQELQIPQEPEIHIGNDFISNQGMTIIAAVTAGVEEKAGEELRIRYSNGASLYIEQERGEVLVIQNPFLETPPFVLAETAFVVDFFTKSVALVGPPELIMPDDDQVSGVLVVEGGEMATISMSVKNNPQDVFVKAGKKVQQELRRK